MLESYCILFRSEMPIIIIKYTAGEKCLLCIKKQIRFSQLPIKGWKNNNTEYVYNLSGPLEHLDNEKKEIITKCCNNQKFGFLNKDDNVNWLLYQDSKSWRFEC